MVISLKIRLIAQGLHADTLALVSSEVVDGLFIAPWPLYLYPRWLTKV